MTNTFTAETPNTTNNEEVTDFMAEMLKKDERFSDPAFMAKSLYNANKLIPTLQSENATHIANAKDVQTRDEMLVAMKAMIAPPALEPAAVVPQANTTLDPAKEVDFNALVAEAMATQKAETSSSTNTELAKKMLSDQVGASSVASAFTAKANELGVTEEFLLDTAAKSPKAFMSYFPATQVPTNPGTYTGGVNPQALAIGHTDMSKLKAQQAELQKTPINKRDKAWGKLNTGLISDMILQSNKET